MGKDDEEASSINKLLFEAFTVTISKMMDEKLDVFTHEMQQMKKRKFTRTGVGTDSYTRPRYLREEKTSYHKESKSVVVARECDNVVLATQHPKVRSETLKTRVVDAKDFKQHKVEPHTRLRKQKEYEEIKRRVQEAFEAVEGRQKKIQPAHQSVDNDQKQGPHLDINESRAEQAKVREQLNNLISNSSHDVITLLTCPKEAEKGTGNVEECSALQGTIIYSDKEMEESSPEPRFSHDSTPNEMDITANSTPHVLFDTKISGTHDLIRYWQNFMIDHSFKYSCFNISISRIMHLVYPMSFEKETGADGAPIILMIKGKPPYWQDLQSIHKEFKQGTIHRIGKCKRSNVELNHSQGRSLTSYIHLKEHRFDKCQLNHRTYGNYLDSQKRMKPELLSLGTGQAILRTQINQRMEYDVDHKMSIYQDQGLHIREETLVYELTPTILMGAIDKEIKYDKISIYGFKDPFSFNHPDIIHLFLPRRRNIGTNVALKRAQRIQKWEEDKLFKPPDLFQNQDGNISIFLLIKEEPPDLVQTRHQLFSFFILIKEEPPDASYKPKTRLHIFGGNFFALHHFMITNLFYVHADNSDLRTNPFQVGEDDIRMASTKDKERHCARSMTYDADLRTNLSQVGGDDIRIIQQFEELGPEEIQEALDVPNGPFTRAKARRLQQAISTMLNQAKSNLSTMIAYPTTLVVIQAG